MKNRASKALCAIVVMAFAAGLAGCASTPDTPYDPLEGMNRLIFDLNQRLDRNAALPAATYYAETVPDPVRIRVRNVLSNLGGPVTAANYLLQGEISYAGEAAGRFLVNTTLGVVGIFDVATDWDMPQRNRDMGLTLGTYGVPEGPYLVLPLGGSSALRDLAGSYVDGYFSPMRYVGRYEGRAYVGLFRNVLGTVDSRSRNLDTYREIERNSVDYYATMRSRYLQRRAQLIEQKAVMTAELPDF